MTPVQSRQSPCQDLALPSRRRSGARARRGCHTFIGIFFFFFWCVCIAFFPLPRALLAQRPISSRWRGSSTGRKRRKSEEGPAPHSARGQNVIPGDVNPVGASDRDTEEGVHCNIRVVPRCPSCWHRLLIASQKGLPRLGTHTALRPSSSPFRLFLNFFFFTEFISCVRACGSLAVSRFCCGAECGELQENVDLNPEEPPGRLRGEEAAPALRCPSPPSRSAGCRPLPPQPTARPPAPAPPPGPRD